MERERERERERDGVADRGRFAAKTKPKINIKSRRSVSLPC